MKVRVLGAHNMESQHTRHTCFLLDDDIAIDAGSLMPALSLEEQKKIRTILLTHRHLDHVRDLPSLALTTLDHGGTIPLYSLSETLETVSSRLMDGVLYPDFTTSLTKDGPKYQLQPVTPGETFHVNGYTVRPIAVPHTAPTVGYIVHQPEGGSFAYCGDTGGGLLPFFEDAFKPDPLFVEVTFPEKLIDRARLTGHLTPDLLKGEVKEAAKRGLSIPRIIIVHRSLAYEQEITEELEQVISELDINITLAQEDMTIDV